LGRQAGLKRGEEAVVTTVRIEKHAAIKAEGERGDNACLSPRGKGLEEAISICDLSRKTIDFGGRLERDAVD